MQHAQQNYRGVAIWALLVVALAFSAETAFSAGIADRGKPDPILSAPADGPCDPALAQPDLTPGTDVEGHQVASANIENGPLPMQGQVLVPLKTAKGKRPSYVTVDGKKLDPLLNPKPSCR